MRVRQTSSNRRWLQIVRRPAALLLIPAACSASSGAQQLLPSAAAPHLALRYEVSASVVAAALTTEGLAIAPDRLHLAMPLSAANPAPQLHVAGAELEHDGSLLLRIICRRAGECMPFFATIAKSDGEAALAALPGLRDATAAATAGTAAAPTAAVVAHPQGIAVGAHITLQLTDAQMHIQLPAVAIDTGAPGSEVRVASLDRKHTWRGIVLNANTVQGGVQ